MSKPKDPNQGSFLLPIKGAKNSSAEQSPARDKTASATVQLPEDWIERREILLKELDRSGILQAMK